METRSWIDINAEVMGGKPCIRDTRVTVDTIMGLVNCGYTIESLLLNYPYLTEEDLVQAATYHQYAQKSSLMGQEP